MGEYRDVVNVPNMSQCRHWHEPMVRVHVHNLLRILLFFLEVTTTWDSSQVGIILVDLLLLEQAFSTLRNIQSA